MFSSEAEVKVYCDDTSESSENKIEEASSLADVRAENAEETDDVSYGEQENLPEVQHKVVEFLNTLISDMGVQAQAKITGIDERLSENNKTYEKDVHIEIEGKGLGMLIGRHGDVLDALQYLSNIVVGRYPKRPGQARVRACDSRY